MRCLVCKGRPRKFQLCVEREETPKSLPPIIVESIQQHLSNTPNDLHGVSAEQPCFSCDFIDFLLLRSTGHFASVVILGGWMLCFGVCGRGEVVDTKGVGEETECVLRAVAIVVAGWCRLACLVFFYIKVHKRMLTESHIYVKSRKISTCELYDTN